MGVYRKDVVRGVSLIISNRQPSDANNHEVNNIYTGKAIIRKDLSGFTYYFRSLYEAKTIFQAIREICFAEELCLFNKEIFSFFYFNDITPLATLHL